MDRFVHLHLHTDYSMLDGAARLDAIMVEVSRLGQPAVAMTDHGNLFGAYAFWQAAKKQGIKPVIGMEAYLAPASRKDRQRDPVLGPYSHITLLARNDVGLRNLFRLSSLASIEGQYYKPRIDLELLEQYNDGLVATTGCLGGAVNQLLLAGLYDEAYLVGTRLADIFGDRLYYEVMEHGIEDEQRIRPLQLDLARKLGVKPVATNDSHYVVQSEQAIHAALLCVQTGSDLSSPSLSFEGAGYYLRSREDMDQLGLPREALDQTLVIAESVESYDSVFAYQDRMPSIPNANDRLRFEVTQGLKERGLDEIPDYVEQAQYEIRTIIQMGFPSYFLVLQDICDEARHRNIPIGPGRGSAAGSLVAYLLGITQLDPLAYGLLFERFLNPDRVSPPDIDIDIDDERRQELVDYVSEKYGKANVAQIATFGTIKTRAAILDANRVLGGSFEYGQKLTGMLPRPIFGKDAPLSEVMTTNPTREARAIRELHATDPEAQEVLDLALGLEGLKRAVGVHASGVILSSEPLMDVCPVFARDDGSIITGFDMIETEKMGLLKMDFLGLRNLSVIRHALDNIKRSRGISVDLSQISMDDDKTYELLSSGNTLGIFQLDSPGMRGLLRILRPSEFLDISACIALYRPGPMGVNAHTDFAKRKGGTQEVTRIHPELDLDDILADTYGLIVYQEQVMAIAQKVAGYTLAQADLLRRAMGKKKKEILDAEFEGFADGMRSNGYSRGAIQTLWDTLVPFADYAFNKAHSAGYGLVSYWTAYLKANFPAEYMAALLTSVKDDPDKLPEYLSECKKIGIEVLPADVNESDVEFSAIGSTRIRYGLSAIKGLGVSSMATLISARGKGFKDFPGFLRSAPQVLLNKRVLDALICAGAFDSMGLDSEKLLEVYEPFMADELERKKNAALGDLPLFVRPIRMHIPSLNYPTVVAATLGAVSYLASKPGHSRLLLRSAGNILLDTEIRIDAAVLDGIDIEAWLT